MPKRIIYSILIAILLLLLCGVTTYSQVVVERSKDKVVISGKSYYIHIVKKGETSYSISKAYGLSVEELVKENPSAGSGLKEGQALRLPIVENLPVQKEKVLLFQPQKDESMFIYHKLVPGETVFSLAKKYGVSENEIVESNPGAEINKLPVGAEIAIPRRRFTNTSANLVKQEEGFITHKVVKGESITSIADKYGTTVREIRRLNRGLIFPKVDDYIKIPVVRVAEAVTEELPMPDTLNPEAAEPDTMPARPVEYTEVRNLRGTYDVALLLPLYFDENSRRTEIDSSQIIKGKRIKKIVKRPDDWVYPGSIPFVEMYQGVLLAADTLRSLGLDVNIHVYDVKSDTVGIASLIESGELRRMDLIIGPVYSNNLVRVAEYASSFQIPVVSPVSLRSNSVLRDNPSLYMVNPSISVAQQKIAQRIKEYPDANFVLIYPDTVIFDNQVNEFKQYIFRELTRDTEFDQIKFKEFPFFSRSALSNDSINRLEHALSAYSDNIILIASEDPAVLSESIMDINSLSKKYSVKVFGYPAMRDLINLDPKNYFDLGIELFSPYWIDYNLDDVRRFNHEFRDRYYSEPEELSFAWLGYDITYFFLSGMSLHGRRFISNPQMHNPDLLSTEFDFRRSRRGDGFENYKLFLIKYTDNIEIKLLDDSVLDYK